VAALGDAEHLTGINPVRVFQHRVVGGEDRHIAVGIAVDLLSDLGQAVAGMDGVEAGLRLKRVALGQVGGCGDSDLNRVQLETCDSDSVLLQFFALRAALEGWHYGFLTGRGLAERIRHQHDAVDASALSWNYTEALIRTVGR
jgi:hypothetical protein